MKKIIALLAACLVLVTFVVGCASDDTADNDGTKPNEGGQYDQSLYEKDDLPELDFGGETVTVLFWNDGEHDEFDITEPSDDMLKNSIYTRNKTVRDRLGINLEYIGTPGFETPPFEQELHNDIVSGACDYDLVASFSMTVAACATSNLCCDLLDYDYLNFYSFIQIHS